MNVKRTFGLVLLATGVLLTLAGVKTIEVALRSPEMDVSAPDRMFWLILGGVLTAGLGVLLNPVDGDQVVD